MLETSYVLTFDIGIRNLAWCLMSMATNTWSIHGWDNYDLLSETSTQTAKDGLKVVCSICKKKPAKFQKGVEQGTCAKCCSAEFPPLKDLSGNICKSIPALPNLKSICARFNPKKKTKQALLDILEKHYSLPIVPVKATRSKTEDLATIHSSMQRFVDENATLFGKASHILLENQPAFKNPTMKSVQILLFATLRDRLSKDARYVGFVHAGKKGTATSEKGDAGYTSRKKASEERVKAFFEKECIADKEIWLKVLQHNQKKSDLCDAMCMCIDKFGPS